MSAIEVFGHEVGYMTRMWMMRAESLEAKGGWRNIMEASLLRDCVGDLNDLMHKVGQTFSPSVNGTFHSLLAQARGDE